MAEAHFGRKTFFMVGGLIIWAAHFMAVYGLNAMVCARQLSHVRAFGIGIVPLLVLLVTVLALGAVGAILVHGLRTREPEDRSGRAPEFIRVTGVCVAALSILAIVWLAVPAFIVSACG